MAEYDVAFVIHRSVRVVAPDLAHAKLQADALVRANAGAKLQSIYPFPYVEPPDAPKHKSEKRDCQCPTCAGVRDWAETVLANQHHSGIDSIPTGGPGKK